MFVSKDKKNKKEAGNSPFLKTSLAYFTAIKKSIALPFPLAYSSKSHRNYWKDHYGRGKLKINVEGSSKSFTVSDISFKFEGLLKLS